MKNPSPPCALTPKSNAPKSRASIPCAPAETPTERTQPARSDPRGARRDTKKAQAALVEIERRARATESLMPAILPAVEAYATVGEISDALRRAFGEHQESVVI